MQPLQRRGRRHRIDGDCLRSCVRGVWGCVRQQPRQHWMGRSLRPAARPIAEARAGLPFRHPPRLGARRRRVCPTNRVVAGGLYPRGGRREREPSRLAALALLPRGRLRALGSRRVLHRQRDLRRRRLVCQLLTLGHIGGGGGSRTRVRNRSAWDFSVRSPFSCSLAGRAPKGLKRGQPAR